MRDRARENIQESVSRNEKHRAKTERDLRKKSKERAREISKEDDALKRLHEQCFASLLIIDQIAYRINQLLSDSFIYSFIHRFIDSLAVSKVFSDFLWV